MTDNKTRPTDASVPDFVSGLGGRRSVEADQLIELMQHISGLPPVLWGPSIIGFGKVHYRYDSGREGEMPILGFSPRKTAVTIYFSEGFDRYADLLDELGKHRTSVSCLYLNKLADADLDVLREMLTRSWRLHTRPTAKPTSVADYIAAIPEAARPLFDELRALVTSMMPEADEVLSYGIVGYKVDRKRARVFISGWKEHVAIYPVPKDEQLVADLAPYRRGRGTLWFGLAEPLPKDLIRRVVRDLTA